MKKLCVALVCFLLVGCETMKKKEDTPPFIPDPTQKVKLEIDERLLKECPPMPDQKFTAPEDIIKVKGVESKMYGACRNNNNELVRLIKTKIGESK